MIKVIDKLFNGDAAENEKLFVKDDEQRQEKLKDAEAKMNLLMETLNDQQKKLFEAWRWADDGLWVYEVDAAYLRGFKTGTHLMIEVYNFNI